MALDNFELAESKAIQHFQKFVGRGEVELINPMKLVNQFGDMTWGDCLRQDLILLCNCAGIWMINNWRDSKGAQLELHVAKELGLAIAYENGDY